MITFFGLRSRALIFVCYSFNANRVRFASILVLIEVNGWLLAVVVAAIRLSLSNQGSGKVAEFFVFIGGFILLGKGAAAFVDVGWLVVVLAGKVAGCLEVWCH